MYLFFDTETTGLPKSWRAPVTDLNNWPRLVQMAWLSFDSDGVQTGSGSHIIKPDGFVIPDDSAHIHGITTARAESEGAPLLFVLEQFASAIDLADTLVAHNMSFDEKIVGAEFLRNNLPNSIDTKNKICTMESSKDFCAIDGQYGYKWPRLTELHHKLFGTDFKEAHNAENDIKATARCFWEMRRLGVI